MANVAGSTDILPLYAELAKSTALPIPKGKKVVIHVDINQTIVPVDAVQQKGASDVVAHAFAKSMRYPWKKDIVPMTYHDFVFNVDVPGPRSDKALKKQRKQKAIHFIDYLETRQLAFAPQVRTTYEVALKMIAASSLESRRVVPSFYRLIETLQRDGVEFTIILRSFGTEVNAVAKELKENTGIAFRRGSFEAHLFQDAEKETPHLLGQSEAYKLFQQDSWAVQDEWGYWNSHEEQFQYGKPFPFCLSPDVHSIFFDDNIFPSDAPTNIVCPYDLADHHYGDIDDLTRRSILVPVDLIATIFDPHYFINHVARSLTFSEIKEKEATA